MTLFENIQFEFNRRLKEESLPRILQCIQLLDDTQLWFSPNQNTNSVGVLILHLSGNIRQYICATFGKEPDIRDRDSEFYPLEKPTNKELAIHISSAINEAVAHVQALSNEHLTTSIPVQCFEESPISILIHVIEHTSYHVGQITWITKSLIDKDLKYYGDLPLSKTIKPST